MINLLESGLDILGVPASRDQLARLEAYLRELEIWNPKLGLVNAAGVDLVVKHLLDCAAGIPELRRRLAGRPVAGAPGARGDRVSPAGERRPRMADLGSGAGLPGLPLAILMPDCDVALVDRSGRRAGFLRNAIIAGRATNARVVESDLDDYQEQVDVFVFRAFHPLSAGLLRKMAPLLRYGGFVLAYKGRKEAIESELRHLSIESGDEPPLTVEIVPVHVPYLDEPRHLVVFADPR